MRGLTKIEEKINSKIGKAIADYGLINDKDKILVAVSGGKDSLTLLSFLKKIQKWAPVKFELFAAHITTDFHCGSYVHSDTLSGLFAEIGVEYKFDHIKVLDEKGKTTCFWCSWNKRKALFKIAQGFGCNKLAFGHHKDDIAETMLMNLFCKGEISTMNPYQEMFKGKLTIIRPLCYVEENLIKEFSKESGFLYQLCKCQFGRDSQREYMKRLIKEIEKNIPGTNVKTNIFKSIAKIKKDYIGLKEESFPME